MAFPLDHWQDPRQTIACRFAGDDIAYATEGAYWAAMVMRAIDVGYSTTQNWTFLDFGCGTGRVARPLAYLFKQVYAYDPQPACIEVAKLEGVSFSAENISYHTDLNTVPQCDVVASFNVLSHLDAERQREAIDAMMSRVYPGGVLVVQCPNDRGKADVLVGRLGQGEQITETTRAYSR